MTYVKIEDDILRHPKVVRVSSSAKLIYLASIFYSGNQLTDGFIPENTAQLLCAEAGVRYSSKLVKELVNAGLWNPTDGGHHVHDYLKYNESSGKVHQKREAARQRMERLRSGGVRANNERTSGEVRDTTTTTDTSSPNGEEDTPKPPRKKSKGKTLSPEQLARFERWYSEWPRKVNRAKAEEKWAEIDPDDELTEVMVAKTQEWASSPEWTKDGGQYIPHPATWLHNKRWTDGSPSKPADDQSWGIINGGNSGPGRRGYTAGELLAMSREENVS